MKHGAALGMFPTLIIILLMVGGFACAQDTITGKGFFIARGSGSVSVSGAGTVECECEGYVLARGDAELDGLEDDAQAIELDDGGVLYINVAGMVQAAGDDMQVTCGGANLQARIRVDGAIVLTGAGYYRLGIHAGSWSPGGTALMVYNPDG
ncbi:hypothetical protein ACFL43_03630 [Thermodesulfobacteriota bacterium]